jgi:hypothetical protein
MRPAKKKPSASSLYTFSYASAIFCNLVGPNKTILGLLSKCPVRILKLLRIAEKVGETNLITLIIGLHSLCPTLLTLLICKNRSSADKSLRNNKLIRLIQARSYCY